MVGIEDCATQIAFVDELSGTMIDFAIVEAFDVDVLAGRTEKDEILEHFEILGFCRKIVVCWIFMEN
jgi:hypothetical protein